MSTHDTRLYQEEGMNCPRCERPFEAPGRNRVILETDDETGLVNRRVTNQLCAECWADIHEEITA